jgi:hypothetical protein
MLLPCAAVTSTFLHLLPRREVALAPGELRMVEAVVRAAFAHRRKTIVNSLRAAADGSAVLTRSRGGLARCGIDRRARAQSVSPEQWLGWRRAREGGPGDGWSARPRSAHSPSPRPGGVVAPWKGRPSSSSWSSWPGRRASTCARSLGRGGGGSRPAQQSAGSGARLALLASGDLSGASRPRRRGAHPRARSAGRPLSASGGARPPELPREKRG